MHVSKEFKPVINILSAKSYKLEDKQIEKGYSLKLLLLNFYKIMQKCRFNFTSYAYKLRIKARHIRTTCKKLKNLRVRK